MTVYTKSLSLKYTVTIRLPQNLFYLIKANSILHTNIKNKIDNATSQSLQVVIGYWDKEIPYHLYYSI